MMAPDPLDFLDLDHLLSDEERQIRGLVRGWVDDNVLPGIEEWFEKIGDSVPTSLRDELDSLKLRLGMS